MRTCQMICSTSRSAPQPMCLWTGVGPPLCALQPHLKVDALKIVSVTEGVT